MISSLGPAYLLLLPLAALLSFVLVLLIVIRGKGPMAAAALVLIVPLPFLIGIFGAIQGAMSSYLIMATSGSTPKPSEIAVGISTALMAPLVGLLLMAPALIIAAAGSFVRSITHEGDSPRNLC